MEFKIKLSLLNKNQNKYMGLGPLYLLKNIDKYNSIKQASIKMNMSYNKAHNILKNLENNVGFDLVKKYKGGIKRGGSELTEKGKKYIYEFEKMYDKLNKITEKYVNEFLLKSLNG